MSMITLTNRVGGQLVCTMTSGKTLRLDNKQSITVEDTEITKHLQNLINNGLVLSKVVEVPKEVTSKRGKQSKVKEEENNA